MDSYHILVIVVLVISVFWKLKTRIIPQTQYAIPERGDPSKKDIVLLGLATSERVASSLSNFTTKMETWLRFQGFDYKKEIGVLHKTPLKKLPVLIHDGQMIPDTTFIIRYLTNTFPNQVIPLSPEQKAMSALVTSFCEKHWTMQLVYNRFLDDKTWPVFSRLALASLPASLKPIASSLLRAHVQQMLLVNGWGKFSRRDQMYMFEEGTAALSTLLGEKKYFTGDVPSPADAFVFGCLDQILHDGFTADLDTVVRRFPNLVEHTKRIRREYYPETWDHKKDAPSHISLFSNSE
eukprot:jgi/Botrbrau1/17008/Bobra.49_2s0066.1